MDTNGNTHTCSFIDISRERFTAHGVLLKARWRRETFVYLVAGGKFFRWKMSPWSRDLFFEKILGIEFGWPWFVPLLVSPSPYSAAR